MLVTDVFNAFRQGKKVVHFARLKNMALVADALAGFLISAALVAKGFGYDLQVSEELLTQVATGVVALITLGSAVVHAITSTAIGLPPKPEDEVLPKRRADDIDTGLPKAD